MSNKKTFSDTQARVLEIGARIKNKPSDTMIDTVFARELYHQAGLSDAMGLVDIAYILTGIKTEMIPEIAGKELLKQLIILQEKPDSFSLDPNKGDLYTNREAWLTEQTTAAVWLGSGRARREATTSAFLLVMRSHILELTGTTIDLGRTLTQLVDKYKQAIMPDYTYLQAAQPTTFGHYLLSFTYPLIRDLERMEQLFTRVNKSPMGCGSTNGSILAKDRYLMADLLGFSSLSVHTRDAMWQPDITIETASVLMTSIVNLSRLAEDIMIYCTQEFNLVDLDDMHSRASKIMPQKKNPFALTHIREIANEIIGLLALTSATARTPTGQPDNRLAIYGTLPDAIKTINECMELMNEVLTNLEFNAERGKELVTSGWSLSTDLAEALVQDVGIDFRSAHKLVGFLAQKFQDESILILDANKVREASESVLDKPIDIDNAFLDKVLNPVNAIQSKQEPGSASVESINAMISECNNILSEKYQHTDSLCQLLIKSECNLLKHAKHVSTK